MKKLVSLIKQIFSFGIVGIICFIIDFFIMVFLTHIFSIKYIISCAISFTISAAVNYILSIKYVFIKTTYMKKHAEFFIFFVMSVFGLILTELLMTIFSEQLSLHYTVSKIIVTTIVMFYNFISRKLVFEKIQKGIINNENTF